MSTDGYYSPRSSFSAGSHVEDEDEKDSPRVMTEPHSLFLSHPKSGDWVEFETVDTSGNSTGDSPYKCRLGACSDCVVPNIESEDLQEYLSQIRLGETKVFLSKTDGQPLRLCLTRHCPRYILSCGATLDIKEESHSTRKARKGCVAFYSIDGGHMSRRCIQESDIPDAVIESLLLMKVGEEATLCLCEEQVGRTLVLHRTSFYEDISPLKDASLWMLSIDSPPGSFEYARPGHVVTACVNGEQMTWTWGNGSVENHLEFSALAVGSGQTAEITSINEDGSKDEFTLYISHISPVLPETSSDDATIEEKCCEVAKRLFSRKNYLLAQWHWSYICSRLDNDASNTSDDEKLKLQHSVLARSYGNLAVVERYLGRYQHAAAASNKNMSMIPLDLKRAKDYARHAQTLEAINDLDGAMEACDYGEICSSVSDYHRNVFRTLRKQVTRKRKAILKAEKGFCARMFA